MKNQLGAFLEYGNKAIDLTRRNRLLKFPKNSKSISFKVDLKTFLKEYGPLEELEIEFHHRFILSPQERNADSSDTVVKNSIYFYVPQTDVVGEKLITLLNALRLETRRKFEEHGLHTLFLAIGKVQWKEPLVGSIHSGNIVSEYDYNAPLLLIPIKIEEKKNPKKTVISAHLEAGDICYNKVLELLLQKEYRSRSIEMPYEDGADWFNIYESLCQQIKNIFVESKLEYQIIDEIQIGQYSFHGQQIYHDLQANKDAILQHEFINALCSKKPIKQDALIVEVENPDVLLTPKDDYNVMDADRSQLHVLQNVINANHLNIQGPPGTGKSQTIVNLISNLIARGKTVLMVCEKQIALEVVLSRLKSVGLDTLCLPLFKHNTDKKIFAKSVLEDCDNVLKVSNQLPKGVSLEALLENREEKIASLRSYARLLGETVQPLNRSLYWVHGQYSKHSEVNCDAKIAWMGSDPLLITPQQYDEIMYLLENIAPLFDLRLNSTLNYWRNINRSNFSPDFVNRLFNILEDVQKVVSKITNIKNDALKFDSIEDVLTVLSSENVFDEMLPVNESLVLDNKLSEALKKLNEVVQCLAHYESFSDTLLKKYKHPLHWDATLNKGIDIIDDSIKISKLQLMASNIPQLKKHLDVFANVGAVYQLNDISMKELFLYKDILLLDQIIHNLNGWDSADNLELITAHLKYLNEMNNHLNAAKKVLDRWGILIDEIDTTNALRISKCFSIEYNTFFRFFNSKYRQDKQWLADHCHLKVPNKYSDFNDIAIAIKTILHVDAKLKASLDSFNKEFVITGEQIKSNQLACLYENAGKLLLNLNRLKEKSVSVTISNIWSTMNKVDMSIFYSSYQIIIEKINHFRGIFKVNVLNLDLNLSDFVKHSHDLMMQLENVLLLNKNVKDINLLHAHDYSVMQIKQNAQEIEELYQIICNIESLNPAELFSEDNIVDLMINDNKVAFDSLASVQQLIAIIEQSRINKNDVNIRQAIQLHHEQKKILIQLTQFANEYSKLILELNRLFENNESIHSIEKYSFSDWNAILKSMFEDRKGLEEWMQFRRYFNQLNQVGQNWFFDATKDKLVTNPASLFAQALWSAWLENYYAKQPALQNFDLKNHQRIIAEFKDLEKLVLKTNASRIIAKHAQKISTSKVLYEDKEQALVRQSQLKMRHQPIRKLVYETGDLLLQYKPCWMVSPLTLSSYIPYESTEFDVVIFDEASQLRVEHALASIARAKQVIIFGDENQLPPTSFFENSIDDDDAEQQTDSYESILHATKEILPGAHDLLTHHYRSKYEDLIAFSNHYVYNDRLVTFPNPTKSYKAVQFEFVEKGCFDGGKGGSRRNDMEAKRVVEICLQQVINEPHLSLGVIAFSRAQEVAIRDALLDALKDKPHLQDLLDETSDTHGKFFIKNLESVQGDERDVIILSIGYGKDKKTGAVYNRFGPINSQYGYRRLNVAITRAKEKVICVSSIKASDIRNAEKSRGAFMLQKYLEYAERGVEALDASLLIQTQQGLIADSPFEEEVEHALMMRGYTVHKQIGVSGFKIDLALVNPKNDQEYILGIECDGATYHSSYSARMNDRIRQEMLERLGWKLYRIWSQHWISNRDEIIEDIIRIISN